VEERGAVTSALRRSMGEGKDAQLTWADCS